MAFYLDPPSGAISYQKLESFALKRLDILLKIAETKGDLNQMLELLCQEAVFANSDCLIIGSSKDKVSHFTLRLMMGGDIETQSFLCQAETALFDLHFSCMSEQEMRAFFRKLDRVIHHRLPPLDSILSQLLQPSEYKTADAVTIFKAFNNIRLCTDSGTWKEVIRLYLEQKPAARFSLPFQCVLPLVAKRQAGLICGYAQVPFTMLREVMRELYYQLMEIVAKQAEHQLSAALSDERMKLLWRKLKHQYRLRHPGLSRDGLLPSLTVEQVDSMAGSYPLCMSTLLQSLRQKHRLGHHDRIQLTLFLKDLGLPVHHAIAMWQSEYSLPSGSGSRCSHSWQRDGNRYTYGIRHLYGLEGARRNYRGHTCQSLQQRSLASGEGGGCPYVHWDTSALTAELCRLSLGPLDVAVILALKRNGHFSAACQRSFKKHRHDDTAGTLAPQSSRPLSPAHAFDCSISDNGSSVTLEETSLNGKADKMPLESLMARKSVERGSVHANGNVSDIKLDVTFPGNDVVISTSVNVNNCENFYSSSVNNETESICCNVPSSTAAPHCGGKCAFSKGRCTISGGKCNVSRKNSKQNVIRKSAVCQYPQRLPEPSKNMEHCNCSTYKKTNLSCMAAANGNRLKCGESIGPCAKTALLRNNAQSTKILHGMQYKNQSQTETKFHFEDSFKLVELEDFMSVPRKCKIQINDPNLQNGVTSTSSDTETALLKSERDVTNYCQSPSEPQEQQQYLQSVKKTVKVENPLECNASKEEKVSLSFVQECAALPCSECLKNHNQTEVGFWDQDTFSTDFSQHNLHISKPLHFFQLSYWQFLDGLKT